MKKLEKFVALQAVHHNIMLCWPYFTLVSSMLVLQLDLCYIDNNTLLFEVKKSCLLGSKII